jgi:dethiobiotin synthetase
MKGLFITGTDTGVGKTFIATQLARALTQHGLRVVPRKPVESGCTRQGDTLIPADALALKNAASYPGTLQQVCPYPFEPAISPARAAQLAGKTIHISDLKAACIKDVNENDFLLVEGAGGFYSPLCADGLNADLAHSLGLPVILVADDRVGCINHCLLALAAAEQRGLAINAIVLNRQSPTTEPMDNAAELALYTNCPIFPLPEKRDAFHTCIRNF